MAKRQLRRYIWLIDTIRRADGITFEEINRQWLRSSLNEDGKGFPKRTFHNHIESILEEFDVEITCDRSDGYRYRIEEYDEYGSVRKAMLDTLALDNAVRECPEIGGRIIFHDQSHAGNLPAIVQALRDRMTVRFRYRHDYSFARRSVAGCAHLPDADYSGEIAIYGLFFCGIWFAVGKVLSDRHLHIYALHRISEIVEQDKRYTIPEDFDVRQYMTERGNDPTGILDEGNGFEDDRYALNVYLKDTDPSFLL